jgi:hypothetical protein
VGVLVRAPLRCDEGACLGPLGPLRRRWVSWSGCLGPLAPLKIERLYTALTKPDLRGPRTREALGAAQQGSAE